LFPERCAREIQISIDKTEEHCMDWRISQRRLAMLRVIGCNTGKVVYYLTRGDFVSEVNTLIETLIRLEGKTQVQISAQSGVPRANLCRFLAGETDMRLSSLTAVLKALDVDLNKCLEREIELRRLQERKSPETLGEAFETLIRYADPITVRTLLKTLSVRSKSKLSNLAVARALEVIEGFSSWTRRVKGSA
jgi:hypothetical protein